MVKRSDKKNKEKTVESSDIAELKKEIMRMRFRRALGESVALKRFREIRRAIAAVLTLTKQQEMKGRKHA